MATTWIPDIIIQLGLWNIISLNLYVEIYRVNITLVIFRSYGHFRPFGFLFIRPFGDIFSLLVFYSLGYLFFFVGTSSRLTASTREWETSNRLWQKKRSQQFQNHSNWLKWLRNQHRQVNLDFDQCWNLLVSIHYKGSFLLWTINDNLSQSWWSVQLRHIIRGSVVNPR